MLELLPTLDRWRAAGRRAAIATITRVRGSSPRPAGARLAIADDGAFVGSISVGCVEADVFEDAQAVLRSGVPRGRHFGIADELGFTVGLSCGGEIDVWIEPDWLVDPAEGAVAAALRQGLAQEVGVCLATTLPAAGPSRHLLVRADGTRVGTTGDPALDARIGAAAGRGFELGTSETVEAPRADSGVERVFLDVYPPPPTLVIFGGAHVAVPLVSFAKRVGFRVIVVDGRARFAMPERFPDADRVLHAWPDDAATQLRLDHSTYVAVLNHDPKFDLPALTLALASGARYVGAIGSRRTRQLHLDRLRALGVSEADLARVHGPIGLDIGARTPEEIAVSILAEMIAVRYGRPGGMLAHAIAQGSADGAPTAMGDGTADGLAACPPWMNAAPASGPR